LAKSEARIKKLILEGSRQEKATTKKAGAVSDSIESETALAEPIASAMAP
jgi:hypothetical protein